MRTGYSEPSAFTGYSSSHSTASGAIGTYCRYKTDQVASTPSFTISWAGDAGGSVKPTIPYGVYILNYSHGAVTLISSATYSIAANSGSCGYSTSGRSTTAFSTSAANTWVPLGLITMTGPTVTIPNFTTTISFTVGTGSLRVAADNFQLVSLGVAVNIAVQPAATASVAANYSGAICSVSAGSTTSPTYIWKRNGTAINGGAYSTYYSGYSSATLSAVSIPSSENGVSLTCTVGGTYPQADGTANVPSGACVLTVGSADPCLGVTVIGGINSSPLAGAGYVYSDAGAITCTGCSGSATAIKILDKSNGNAVVGTATGGSATVVVGVGALTTGHILCAVQTVGGQDSCVASAPTVTVGNSGCTYVAAVGGVATANPITAEDTSVDVTGVSASAQDVTVYANGVQVGQNTAPAGQTTVTVTTSPLVKGQYLTASQKLSGTEGCIPGSTGAPIVGGGNAALTVCLEFTVGSTAYLWLGANGRQGGYASAPTGATVVNPGVGWQTVTWTPGTSPSWNWGTASSYTFPTSGSATLQYIWLCPNDNNEMGPYTVYIDTVQNGTASLYNWEGDTIGLSAFMQNPSYATTGRTPVHDSPNLTACVNTNADMGAECQRMDWEFINTASANSIRGVLKNGITVDLSKPISFRILVLPAGTSAPALTLSQPGAKTLTSGTADSVSITATDHSGGTSTMAYQWKRNGVAITSANAGDRTGYTTATLAFGAPVAGDAGSYSCTVTDTVTGVNAGTYTGECAPFVVTVNKGTPTITWANPADITYGTALSGTQLDATASVPGTFVYSPLAGTVLNGGASQALGVTFTPTDTANYNGASATVHINVNRATTSGILSSSENPANPGDSFTFTATVSSSAGTPTGSVQFKADGNNLDGPVTLVGGTASYGPTILSLGSHAVQAVYGDAANFLGTTANLTQLVDTAPTSPNLAASTAKNQPLVLSFDKLVAKASDPDAGDTLSVSAAGPTSAHGSANNVALNVVAQTISYTPATDYTGSDSFTYTITDSYGRTVTPTVNVTVTSDSATPPNVVSTCILANGHFHAVYAGIPTFTYRIETAPSCDGPWTSSASSCKAGDNGLFEFEDTTQPPPSSCFYRAVCP
jgi:hypothetical protein